MRFIAILRLRLRSILRREWVEADLDEELRYHLDRLAEQQVARGATPDEARLAALREMGGIDRLKEESRDARGVALADDLFASLRLALRGLRRSPVFTVVAVASLALGIGASTTIFSFVDAVLLTPLPYPESHRLVVLREKPPGSDETLSVDPRSYLEWKARTRSFDALALVQTPPLDVIGPDGAEQIGRAEATPELFGVFGVAPALGRPFTTDEARPGGAEVVVIGHRYWQRRFGGDPGIIGKPLVLRDGALTIVGVAPRGFRLGTAELDAFTPLRIDPSRPNSVGGRSFDCYGRLRPGVDVAEARAEMTAIGELVAREYADEERMGVVVSGLHDYLVREGRPALRVLMAAVLAVLLVACTNVAGLQLARGLQRRGEMALRVALGASRRRLVGQLVVESLVLALIGGGAAVVLAFWATPALGRLTAGALRFGVADPPGVDVACLVFALGAATASVLLFGLLPALRTSRVEPRAALQSRGRGGLDRRQHNLRRGLVVGEIALAVVLLVAAGLLLRTFDRLVSVDPGIRPESTTTVNLFLGLRPPEARARALERIIENVEGIPGVEAAGTIQFLPLSGWSCKTGFRVEGVGGALAEPRTTGCALVSRGYFAAMGIPVLRGRAFTAADRMGGPRVVIVSRSFARLYLEPGAAVGRRILVDSTGQAPAEIVGVVGDVRHDGLTSQPQPMAYLLHAQTPGYITNLVVRSHQEPAAMAEAIRRAVHEADPQQAVAPGKAMTQYVDDALARPRLYAALVGAFAAIALALAAVGVYGLMAYVVAQRRHELGVRFALGATRGRVFAETLAGGARLTAVGLVVGVLGAAALRGVLTSLVFGVSVDDPRTYLGASLILAAAAFGVSAAAALRAAQVDPSSALRYE